MGTRIRRTTRLCLIALVVCGAFAATPGSAQEPGGATAKPARDKQAVSGGTATADAIMGQSPAPPKPAPVRAASPAAPKPTTGAKTDPLASFPRHPGLYHRGTVEFFLDCPEPLSENQVAALNGIKAKANKELADADKKIAAAERELFKLTAIGSPDASTIAAKIGEIERTRAQRRMRFIRRVGEAASVLTDEQRAAMIRGAGAPEPLARSAAGSRAPPPPEADDGDY